MKPGTELLNPIGGTDQVRMNPGVGNPAVVEPGAPGFLLGLWHGFIFPIAWIVSLFVDSVAIYAVPNNGGWYDFGYFLGIVVFGVGARKSHIVYRDRVRR